MILLFLIATFFIWKALPAYLDQRQQVSQDVFLPSISAPGVLQSQIYNLNFQNNNADAVLSKIYVHQGQFVHKGQMLARLNTNALAAAVAGERKVVAIARYHIVAAMLWLRQSILQRSLLVAQTQHSLISAQNNLNAIYRRAQADIAVAQVTLANDARLLAGARIQEAAHISNAQAQLIQGRKACQTNFSSAASSSDDSGNAPSATDVLKTCMRVAQTQYWQSLADAHDLTVLALAAVSRDRVLLTQAIAATRVNIVVAQGELIHARGEVPIALADTEPFIAQDNVIDKQHALAQDLAILGQAQIGLENATLVAPHDGVVTAINGTIGGLPGVQVDILTWAVGSAPSNVFIQLVDLSQVNRMELDVNETDIINVKVGQHVQFTIKAYGNRQFSGAVSAISPNGISSPDGKTRYPVIVSIDAGSTRGLTLYPNMTTSATIALF